MIKRPAPIAVRDKVAAKMLDLDIDEFRGLVAAGSLPPPKAIGPHDRWRVADLDAILTGEAMETDFEP